MKKIPLYGKGGAGKYALVDDEDFDVLTNKPFGRWSTNVAGYTQGWNIITHKVIYMHRVVLKREFGDRRHTDHINFNKLDNRKENLRIGNSINSFNRSKPQSNSTTGVLNVHKVSTGYQVRITINGEKHYYGFTTSLIKAKALAKVARAEALTLIKIL